MDYSRDGRVIAVWTGVIIHEVGARHCGNLISVAKIASSKSYGWV